MMKVSLKQLTIYVFSGLFFLAHIVFAMEEDVQIQKNQDILELIRESYKATKEKFSIVQIDYEEIYLTKSDFSEPNVSEF